MGDTVEGAQLKVAPIGKGPWTTSNGWTVLPKVEFSTTDSTGRATLEVYRTSAVTNTDGDSLYYDVSISKTGYIDWQKKNYMARDSLTQRIR